MCREISEAASLLTTESASFRQKTRSGSSAADLLPGLPNSIVLDCILPLLPWYSRFALSSASRSWRSSLLHPSRASGGGGLIVAHLVPDAERASIALLNKKKTFAAPAVASLHIPLLPTPPQALSIWDGQQWRRLPPIPASHPLPLPPECGLACANGCVFVIGGFVSAAAAASAAVFSLDLASGDWRWRLRKPMPFPRTQLHCRTMVGGRGGARIVVVGAGPESPRPLAYNVEKDDWAVLPPVVAEQRSVSFGGLAATRGGATIVAFGWVSSADAGGGRGGEMAGFWREYDEESGEWRKWAEGEGCSRLVAGDMDLREGVVAVLDPPPAPRRWRVVEGRLRSQTWWREENGGGGELKRVATESSCAHSFVVVGSGGGTLAKPPVQAYATVCEGERRHLTLWRADFDTQLSRATWHHLPVPGNLAMCSQIAYLQA